MVYGGAVWDGDRPSYAATLVATAQKSTPRNLSIAVNVPLNEALATVNPNSSLWAHYLTTWPRWNHIRAIALGAVTLLSITL